MEKVFSFFPKWPKYFDGTVIFLLSHKKYFNKKTTCISTKYIFTSSSFSFRFINKLFLKVEREPFRPCIKKLKKIAEQLNNIFNIVLKICIFYLLVLRIIISKFLVTPQFCPIGDNAIYYIIFSLLHQSVIKPSETNFLSHVLNAHLSWRVNTGKCC